MVGWKRIHIIRKVFKLVLSYARYFMMTTFTISTVLHLKNEFHEIIEIKKRTLGLIGVLILLID